jgi:hypothetical protein
MLDFTQLPTTSRSTFFRQGAEVRTRMAKINVRSMYSTLIRRHGLSISPIESRFAVVTAR